MPQKESKTNKIVMIGLVVVFVGATVYFLFFRNKAAPDLLTSTTSSDGGPVVGQVLVTELNRLKALKSINKDLFNDPAFVSLVDIEQPVEPQPLGRSNPFSPVGSDF